MKTSDFDYNLPQELIARYPLDVRSSSRLMCLSHHELKHSIFSDLPSMLSSKDLLILNNTKVIPARLFAVKETGGKVELLVERIIGENCCYAHIKTNKPLKLPALLSVGNQIKATVKEKIDDIYKVYFDGNLREILKKIGKLPLPRYLKREAEEIDDSRYQTIYCQQEGAVAAPTAGLHFDQSLFNELHKNRVKCSYITLHVGAGTFKPVLIEDFKQHKMHREVIDISPSLCEEVNAVKAAGGRIIAVGTTTVRALETAMQGENRLKPYSGETNIFIYPGYRFRCVDALVTNFHLPRSTLLMLVCALGGYEKVMAAYESAVHHRYRFYSYGDAMFIANREKAA